MTSSSYGVKDDPPDSQLGLAPVLMETVLCMFSMNDSGYEIVISQEYTLRTYKPYQQMVVHVPTWQPRTR